MTSANIALISSTMGIISTTVFWGMNTTINYLTFPALLVGGAPKPSTKPSSQFLIASDDTPAVSVNHLNRQWQEIYWRGHRVGPTSAKLSGLSFLTAAYFSGTKPPAQVLYVVAAAAAMSAWPYTLVAMVPLNDELHRRGDAQLYGGLKDDEKKYDDQETFDLLMKWLGLSKVRASLAFVATCAGVAAMLL